MRRRRRRRPRRATAGVGTEAPQEVGQGDAGRRPATTPRDGAATAGDCACCCSHLFELQLEGLDVLVLLLHGLHTHPHHTARLIRMWASVSRGERFLAWPPRATRGRSWARPPAALGPFGASDGEVGPEQDGARAARVPIAPPLHEAIPPALSLTCTSARRFCCALPSASCAAACACASCFVSACGRHGATAPQTKRRRGQLTHLAPSLSS